MYGGGLRFESLGSFVLELNSRVHNFVHHFAEFDFVFGEYLIDGEFENLFERFFFLSI